MNSRAKAAPDAAVQEMMLADEGATAALARRLAAQVRIGDVIALRGDLGAGKTSFARAFIGALLGEPEEVPSPTFTLVQTYDSPIGTVWHFDLYRLERPGEVVELGLDDALSHGIVLIEWPDRLQDLIPPDRLDLSLDFVVGSPLARRARLVGHGSWSTRLQADGRNG